MRKARALVSLCGAASLWSVSTTGLAGEKPDHWLLLMVDAGNGQAQYGDQMVPSKTCHVVAEKFAKAEAEKKRFTLQLSTNPKVAGEVLLAACITPDGGIMFLTQIGPHSRVLEFSEGLTKFSEYITQRVNELSKKP
jgi:hypothetical protein